MVTLKLAASLDGRIATASGESRWITGPEARARVHAMRATHDAVMVGAGTARADDPMLTVRGLGVAHQPVRVVAARGLDLDTSGNLGGSAREVPVWLVHGAVAPAEARARWTAAGARLIEVAEQDGALAPAAILAALGAAGLTRVLCEGGVAASRRRSSARVSSTRSPFTAGLALGGDARPALGPLGLAALGHAARFRLSAVERIGGDTLSRWHGD